MDFLAAAAASDESIDSFLQGQQGFMRDFMRMTPEEQEKQAQQLQAGALRHTLSRAGFGESVAEAVLAFLAERAEARRRIRTLTTILYLCEVPKPTLDAGDDAIATLLEQYEAAAQDERERRSKAEDALDERITWKSRPRLKSFLLREGIVGDAAWLAQAEPVGTNGTDSVIVREWNEKGTLPDEFAWILGEK